MAKECPQCSQPNLSKANFCAYCGTVLSEDGSINEDAKLHKELNDAKQYIELLKKSLADALEKTDSPAFEEETKSLNAQLVATKDELKNLQNQIAARDEEIEQLKFETPEQKSNNIWIFVFVLLCIALGITAFYFYDMSDSRQRTIDNLESENNKLNNEVQELKSGQQDAKNDNKNLRQKLDDISAHYPIIIKSIKVGNVYKDGTIATDYGSTIYASNSMFLKPQIEYKGLKASQTITLYQKLYKNGGLETGTSSPSGYSTKYDLNISDEDKIGLTGFGSETKGNWASGSYRYEIWYNNMCLKAIDFYLY